MTNDATRASATALPEINRRRFLTNAATAGAAVAVAATAVAPVVVEAASLSTLERFNAAVDALKVAAMEMDPTIREWIVGYATDPRLSCRVVITAFDSRIDGDGPLLADDVTGTTAYADWEASHE